MYDLIDKQQAATAPMVNNSANIVASGDQIDLRHNNNNNIINSNNHSRANSASNRSRVSSISTIPDLHPQSDLKLNTNFMLMPINDQIKELQTVIRDKNTNRGDFKFAADRLIRLVIEMGLNQLPVEKIKVSTPTGHFYEGLRFLKNNCGVSIVRSGESMEEVLRHICRSIRIGKILIESGRVVYEKLPPNIAERRIVLLYPILSTGLAVMESVKLLTSRNYGVKEENILLLSLFSSPKAAKLINQSYPKMLVLTSEIKYPCPVHFSKKYFGV